MAFFKKKGYICWIERDDFECNMSFNTRGMFVVSQKPNNRQEYDRAILLSKMYINYKVMGCVYDDKMMEKIVEMEKNLFSE